MDIEAIGADYIHELARIIATDNVWTKRLARSILAKKGRFVLRTSFLKKDEYLKHMKNTEGWEKEKFPDELIDILARSLTIDKVWMTEISLPELYPANKGKIGEIVFDPGKKLDKDKKFSNCSFIRVLDEFYFFEEGEIKVHKIGITSHNKILEKYNLCA